MNKTYDINRIELLICFDLDEKEIKEYEGEILKTNPKRFNY